MSWGFSFEIGFGLVVELFSFDIEDNFCGVVEEDPCGSVAQDVTEAVLGGVVNPLPHPDLVGLASRRWLAQAGGGGVVVD